MLCATVAPGGNRALMEDAEQKLRQANEAVLDAVPSERIPESGRMVVTADVQPTDGEPRIDLKEVRVEPVRKAARIRTGKLGKPGAPGAEAGGVRNIKSDVPVHPGKDGLAGAEAAVEVEPPEDKANENGGR